MSHPFGDLLGQYLHRKHGLSQFKLADGINQPPSVISEMCQGKRLSGHQARTRIVAMIQWLLQQRALNNIKEANELLNAAGFSPLKKEDRAEASILLRLSQSDQPLSKRPVSQQQARLGFRGLEHTRSHNLPHQFTRFVGRLDQISELTELMKTHRMLTLTGAGGVGKTRLAIEVATSLLDDFNDGAWFIDLAPLSNLELVSQKLLEILQISEQPSRTPIESILFFLGTKDLLLILDNCEHLIEGIALLADRILREAPQVSLLATSREALRIPAEFTWKVPSLTRPQLQSKTQMLTADSSLFDSRGLTTESEPGSLEQYESVNLFVDRVQNLQPTFRLQDDNAPAVAHICSRLDGIPLALEMAAAWVNALTIEEIATRLSGAIDSRFHMLTSSSRTVSHRQLTLRATMEWSYALLSPDEQQLLLRLPVFTGSWTTDVAEKICSDDRPGGIVQTRVLSLLAALIEKNLVIADPENEQTRYRMLETIRQYAYEKQADEKVLQPVDYECLRSKHLEYFVGWVEKAEKMLFAGDQTTWLDRFQREHENIRAALEWGLSNQQRCAEQCLRLAVTSAQFFLLCGYIREGRSFLTLALNPGQINTNTALWALGLTRLADLAYYQSDFQTMHRLLDESISIWRTLDLEGSVGHALALMLLGELRTEEGDYTTAINLYNESLIIYQAQSNDSGICELLMMIGWAAMRTGNYVTAQTRLEESLELARKKGYTYILALVLSALGELAVRQCQYARASALLEESLALRRSRGEQWGVASALGTLGWAALRQGDYGRMRSLLKESAAIRIEIGDKAGIAWCLEKLAEGIYLEARNQPAATLCADYEQAVCVFGAAAGIRSTLGAVMDQADRPEYERNLTMLRKRIGEEQFLKNWSKGGQMVSQDQSPAKFFEPGW